MQVSTPSTSPTWIGLPVPKRSGLVKESSPSDTGTGNTDLVFTVLEHVLTCIKLVYVVYIYIFLKISRSYIQGRKVDSLGIVGSPTGLGRPNHHFKASVTKYHLSQSVETLGKYSWRIDSPAGK